MSFAVLGPGTDNFYGIRTDMEEIADRYKEPLDCLGSFMLAVGAASL
jgi:hypothetical protein